MELLNSDLTLKKFNLGGLTSLGGGTLWGRGMLPLRAPYPSLDETFKRVLEFRGF